MKGRGWITALLLGPAIVVAVVAGWFLFRGIDLYSSPYTVDGVVVDLLPSRDSDGDVTYAPVVEYEVDGVTYLWESSVSYGGLVVPDIGDTRTLVYDPDDPADATGRSLILFIVLPGVFLLGSVIFGGLVIVFATHSGRRARARTGVAESSLPAGALPPMGRELRIEADFMGVEPSPLGPEGDVRYRITAKAEIDGVVHRFTSDWMDEDPTLRLMERGNRVGVVIDPADPTRYRVELESL
jgi:hypothetical protein